MSTEFHKSDKTQIEDNDGFEKSLTSKTKFEPELMKCGKVFVCFISEDFVFFCGLCKNTNYKYTAFEEFASHIKKSHLMTSNDENPNSGLNKMYTEREDEFRNDDKKLSSDHNNALTEFEVEYLNYDDEIQKNCLREHFDKSIESSQSADDYSRSNLQPKEFLLQWPDYQILQFIELFHQQECLWNAESKIYHKSKVKEDAYQHIFQIFNDLNPNVLDDLGSVKKAIDEILDLFSDFGEEQEQNIEVSSNREIFEKLQFLKNTSRSKSISISEITYPSDNDENYFDEMETTDNDCDNVNSNELNNVSDTETLSSDAKYCPVCRVSFESSKDLKTHLSDLSSNLKKKTCHICGANFEDRNSMIIHLRNHKKEKPFQCDVCSKSFATLTEIESHSAMHSQELPFVCEKCGLQFKYFNRLETHKLLHGEPSFECPICCKKFLLKRHLAYHVRQHGPIESATCNTCRKTFRNKDSLLRHERKIHKIMKRRRSD